MAFSNEPVARVDEISAGGTRRVGVAGRNILLCNDAGTIYAIEDVCTHDGGDLAGGEVRDCRIACPRHGAEFDLQNGTALTLPAILSIQTFPVRIENGAIFVDA